jgi:hypothetical protein
MFKTITVQLEVKEQVGTDEFNRALYNSSYEDVEGVLVMPTTTEAKIQTNELYGKHAVYSIAIPKGDSHEWDDKKVKFFGQTWQTIGPPMEAIEENVPTRWHKKVNVERFDG